MSVSSDANPSFKSPDFGLFTQSTKAIARAAAALADGPYGYFADILRSATTVSADLDRAVVDALASLPSSLDALAATTPLIENMLKVDEAEASGAVTSDKANEARTQLLSRVEQVTKATVSAFERSGATVAEHSSRLAEKGRTVEVRVRESLETETSNHQRAKATLEQEKNRLGVLIERLEAMNKLADDARGTPAEDLLALLPDEDELSGLFDAAGGLGSAGGKTGGKTDGKSGKADGKSGKAGGKSGGAGAGEAVAAALAPEFVAAKKAAEFALGELKKILALVDKTIKWERFVQIRNELATLVARQQSVVDLSRESLADSADLLDSLQQVQASSVAMATGAREAGKLSTAFATFAHELEEQVRKPSGTESLADLSAAMRSYLGANATAKQRVIVE